MYNKGGRGGLKGGGLAGTPPPPWIPLWSPPKAGRRLLSFNPLGTEAKFWPSASNIGRGGGGGKRGEGGPPPPQGAVRRVVERSGRGIEMCSAQGAEWQAWGGPWGGGGCKGALEGKGPQERLDRRLEEVAKAVGGGYCRLQMPLRLALGVRETVAGHRLGALEGGYLFPLPTHPLGEGGRVGHKGSGSVPVGACGCMHWSESSGGNRLHSLFQTTGGTMTALPLPCPSPAPSPRPPCLPHPFPRAEPE